MKIHQTTYNEAQSRHQPHADSLKHYEENTKVHALIISKSKPPPKSRWGHNLNNRQSKLSVEKKQKQSNNNVLFV